MTNETQTRVVIAGRDFYRVERDGKFIGYRPIAPAR